jgi:MOSC domain-containing protein YiiM
MARLFSVNVGLPRDIAWQGKTVHTAVWKEPVRGRRMVRRLSIDGDGQGDLVGHCGEHRYWQNHLGRSDFSYREFGENFTIEGLSNDGSFGSHQWPLSAPSRRVGYRPQVPRSRPPRSP